MRSAFVKLESFKHKFAKQLLYEWLCANCFNDFCCDRVEVEYPLVRSPNAKPSKIVDIAAFRGTNICTIFEVYHTHRIEKNKLDRLAAHWSDVVIYEINADMILNLTSRPSSILDLCEHMSGRVPSVTRNPKKTSKPYMFSEEIIELSDGRYAELMK